MLHARTGQYSVLAPVLSPALVAVHQPSSCQTEALRGLRSELILRWFNEHNPTLAVMAPHGREGCSTVAANLAISLAQLGEPTLLVDANFRQPRQHELFGLTPRIGLSDLLRDRDFDEEALAPIAAVENLHVLCTGAVPGNPQELLSRAAFTHLLRTAMPERFRAIIIDTPPALAYADAHVIAARARGCVLVIRRHRTCLKDVEKVKGRLVPTDAVVLGAVLNG